MSHAFYQIVACNYLPIVIVMNMYLFYQIERLDLATYIIY